MKNINALNCKSLRLSFAEKGRITLSKASSPPLEDTGRPWFIGIAIKDKSETTIKNVTLTLESSFDYDYATPFYFLIFLSFFGGIAVALWALFCFREPYNLAMEDEHIDDSAVSFSSPMAASHRMKDNLRSLFSSCWKKKEDEQADELRPLIRGKKEKNPLTWRELFKAMKNGAVYPLVRARIQNILLHYLYCRFCPFGWFIPVCLRRLARDDTYGRQGQVLLQ